jgi:hypothetical protein
LTIDERYISELLVEFSYFSAEKSSENLKPEVANALLEKAMGKIFSEPSSLTEFFFVRSVGGRGRLVITDMLLVFAKLVGSHRVSVHNILYGDEETATGLVSILIRWREGMLVRG